MAAELNLIDRARGAEGPGGIGVDAHRGVVPARVGGAKGKVASELSTLWSTLSPVMPRKVNAFASGLVKVIERIVRPVK